MLQKGMETEILIRVLINPLDFGVDVSTVQMPSRGDRDVGPGAECGCICGHVSSPEAPTRACVHLDEASRVGEGEDMRMVVFPCPLEEDFEGTQPWTSDRVSRGVRCYIDYRRYCRPLRELWHFRGYQREPGICSTDVKPAASARASASSPAPTAAVPPPPTPDQPNCSFQLSKSPGWTFDTSRGPNAIRVMKAAEHVGAVRGAAVLLF